MMRLRTYLVILLTSGAVGMAADSPGLPQIAFGAEGVDLRHWLLLGPFEAKPGEAAVDIDFMARLGRTEEECGRSEILRWAAALPSVGSIGRPGASVVDGAVEVDFGELFNSRPLSGSNAPQTAVYAACEITAEVDGEAWLLFGSDDGAKVWLNGRLQYAWRERRYLSAHADAIRLPLHRGTNLLLIKVANVSLDWMMRARLESDAASAARTMLDSEGGTLLKRMLISPGEPFEFRPIVTAIPGAEVRLESYDSIKTRRLRVDRDFPEKMTDLPSGLYRLSMDLGGRQYTQKFYWGKIEHIHADLVAKSSDLMGDPRAALQLGTLQHWLKGLLRAMQSATDWDEGTRRRLFAEQERKIIQAVSELYDVVPGLQRGEEVFRHRAGLHVRGFRSAVDDQILNYILFVPSSYRQDGAGLPLVIVATTVFTRRASYLESPAVDSYKEIRQWSEAAEKLGVGILWPGYRVCPYGNPSDFTHLDEVLAAVGGDYRIDPARLYLYGNCSGGMTAAMEAVRNPRRYAAIAFLNPVLHRVKNRYDDNGDFEAWPAYGSWLRQNDPLVPLAAIDKLPIWIIHDGIDPAHGPLADSVDFIEQSRAAGHRPRFDNYRKLSPPPTVLTIFQRQLAWLIQQRRDKPEPLFLATDKMGGPLSRALAERFILIEATSGNADEQAANQKLSADFQEAWQRTNYGPCRVIKDRDLAIDEEQRSHLVLLGNAATNLVWNRLAPRLPITVEPTRIIINERTYESHDEALAFQAWFPNPTQPGKKVILIGGAQPDKASFGTMELSLDGWFDFAVWRKEADKAVLLEAGYFDSTAKSAVAPAAQ